jgi:hypothetical protein
MVLQRAVSTPVLTTQEVLPCPLPALAQEIRAAVANLALLAPTAHHTTSDVVIDVLLTPLTLGGKGTDPFALAEKLDKELPVKDPRDV